MPAMLGDFPVGTTIPFFFGAYDSAGAGVTITGLALTDIEIFSGTSMTQRASDNGYSLLDTDGTDLDGMTGIHGIAIDTSDNSDSGFFAAGGIYNGVIYTVTIDGETVPIPFMFTLGMRLYPTTIGRTLDVSSGGEAGLDWANIGSPTTTVGLSGTTVKTATDVETDTADIQSRIPAALGANGNIKADVRDYNGVAGTFAFGKPAVNTTDWNGTAISSEIPTTLISVGTGTGQLQVSSGVVQSNAVQFSGSSTAADNAEIVFDTDFATNYNTTRDAWVTNVQDTAGSGNLPANVKAISDDATAADNAEAFFDGTGYAGTNNVIPTVTTTTNLTNAPTSGDLTATMKASVNAEVDAAIETYHLHRIFHSAYDPTSKPGNASGLLNVLVENDSGVPRYTVNALEQAPAGGGGGGLTEQNITDIAAAVTAALSGRTIVIQSPLDGSKVTLYTDADYDSNTQRLVITNSTGGGWPNGSTYSSLKLVVRSGDTETAYGTGVWIVESGAGAQVAFSIPSEDMAAMKAAMTAENSVIAAWAYKPADETARFPLLPDGNLRLVNVPWVSS